MSTRVGEAVDGLVDATPPDRDRVVDAVRAMSLAVVVVWHWSLSINHRDGYGRLVNPNPIEDVPAAWAATWLLQVMPLFFVVGGFANMRGWRSGRDRDVGAVVFLRRRAVRLLVPVGVFVGVWAAVAAVEAAVWSPQRTVVDRWPIVFMPLWFVGAYLVVVAAVPLTAAAHLRASRATLAGLTAAVVVVDAVRFTVGPDAIGWANLVLVWVLVHQLGYWWADDLVPCGRPRATIPIVLAAIVVVATVTSLEIYPRAFVATEATGLSHLTPPTAVIPVVAVLQLAVVLTVYGWLTRVLRHRRAWSVVVTVNAVIMTIFVWHMTALLVSVALFEAAGGTLGDTPTASWWLTRPLWVLGPLVVLIPLVAIFAAAETLPSRPSSR